MISIKGCVEHIIFRNPDNGYTVLRLKTDDGDITLVGLLGMVTEGDLITATGDMTYHSSYGEQFSVSEVSFSEPETKEAIELYLASGIVKGIGPALAKRIVDRFGEDTFSIMSREPERLSEIKGISPQKAIDIYASYEEKAGLRRAIMFLQQYGIRNTLALKVYERYHEGIYSVITENPYALTEDIAGVGFKTADEIAEKVGIERHSAHRIKAGVLYVLSQAAYGEGNTCLPEDILLERASGLLNIAEGEMADSLSSLETELKIKRKNIEGRPFVYLRSLYYSEMKCAHLLKELDTDYGEDYAETESRIREIEEEKGLILDPDQRSAVISAVMNGVFILTGGPGTGKTTTLRILLEYFSSRGFDVSLTAPTGRAAKRMSEACGMEAKTIHRLLEVSGIPGEGVDVGIFGRNKETPLETDVVIADEMSMVDINLFHALLTALEPGMRLIMVGDEHQLPSVGPGSVLKDILASGRFKSLTLKKIFRQGQRSDIVMNAHALLNGLPLKTDNKSRDFFFLERSDANSIIAGIIYLIKEKLPPYLNVDPNEIQVLSPMKKGLLGVENLNLMLQKAFNPPSYDKPELKRGEVVLRLGDRVIQTKNNYRMEWVRSRPGESLKFHGNGVFNGDLGMITELEASEGSLTVSFEDGREAVYCGKDINELELSYAVTIHKSQGSEYSAVIMPLLSGPEILFSRNLLYTGITRARKCVLIMGSRDTLNRMAGNTREQERYSGLKEELEKEDPSLRSG